MACHRQIVQKRGPDLSRQSLPVEAAKQEHRGHLAVALTCTKMESYITANPLIRAQEQEEVLAVAPAVVEEAVEALPVAEQDQVVVDSEA